jgi:hypothetical protein
VVAAASKAAKGLPCGDFKATFSIPKNRVVHFTIRGCFQIKLVFAQHKINFFSDSLNRLQMQT